MRLLTRLFSIDGVGDVRDGQDQRGDVPGAQLLPDLGLIVKIKTLSCHITLCNNAILEYVLKFEYSAFP